MCVMSLEERSTLSAMRRRGAEREEALDGILDPSSLGLPRTGIRSGCVRRAACSALMLHCQWPQRRHDAVGLVNPLDAPANGWLHSCVTARLRSPLSNIEHSGG